MTRRFTHLKLRLMPYLYQCGLEATATGVPVLRPMPLEFPDDPAVAYLDRQYMLGPDILVAPVFSASGDVELYLPAGTWTHLLTGDRVTGGGWRRERHGFDSLPIYVRPGAVIPWGAHIDRPDRDWFEGLTLRVFPGGVGTAAVTVTNPYGRSETFHVDRAEITE